MKFEELNLHNETLQINKNANQTEANPFQEAILKAVNSEQDLVLKTGENEEELNAVALALVDQYHKAGENKGTRALVLISSAQKQKTYQENVTQLNPKIDCVSIEASGDADVQSKTIEEVHKIVIADPNQLLTILRENRYIFRDLKLLVFIGFDEMVAAQLEDTLANIKKRILCDCVTVIVTNDYKGRIKQKALKLVNRPLVEGFGSSPSPNVSTRLVQNYIKVPPRMKITTLMAHLLDKDFGRCIIFTDSKRGTDKLYRILKKQRLNAVSLHYKLSDDRKEQRLNSFASGNVQYLLVSDISASQLEINDVTQIINYDVPSSADEYRYRAALIGGHENTQIVSLVSKQDQSDLNKLQKELGEAPVELPLPDKVKQKMEERKVKRSQEGRNGKDSAREVVEELSLPRPTYDQLKGGRAGNYENEEAGIVNFFKKLFS